VTNYPLVCICIPTYNSSKTIKKTLTSILNQKYKNIVVHISDNASTDNTIEIIETITDPRIKIHRNNKNIGGEGNFNRCIAIAEGKYTAIFHADDIYKYEMVYKQIEFLEANHDAGAVYCQAQLINELGEKKGIIKLPNEIYRDDGLYSFEMIFRSVLKNSNFLTCPSFMVRTNIYKYEIIYWREDKFRTSSDLDVWLRILKKYKIGHIPETLMYYMLSSSQWSSKTRLSTERADFFLVIDYYLQKENIRALLDRKDWNNLHILEQRDRVMRSVNLFIEGKDKDTVDLLNDINTFKIITGAIKNKRGMAIFLLGNYLKITKFLKINYYSLYFLKYMKRVMNK
jgi:glycosyltransferase involved in cell wall biosynthesis